LHIPFANRRQSPPKKDGPTAVVEPDFASGDDLLAGERWSFQKRLMYNTHNGKIAGALERPDLCCVRKTIEVT
jgi:hypothetical protein